MAIQLVPNKHIGIIFQPRSGSTLLRHYLKYLLNYVDTGEMFNLLVEEAKLEFKGNNVRLVNGGELKQIKTDEQSNKVRALEHLNTLDKLTSINKYCIFGIYTQSYQDYFPELSNILFSRSDIQFFKLDRADFLYSLISAWISKITGKFHSITKLEKATLKERTIEPFIYPIEELEWQLINYIKSIDHIDFHFPNLKTIYYEEFQMKPSNIMNLFTGVPKKILSLTMNKFVGDYKEKVLNLEEIETYYENFVNLYPKYFPQYHNKLSNIVIPPCQGRQPNQYETNREFV